MKDERIKKKIKKKEKKQVSCSCRGLIGRQAGVKRSAESTAKGCQVRSKKCAILVRAWLPAYCEPNASWHESCHSSCAWKTVAFCVLGLWSVTVNVHRDCTVVERRRKLYTENSVLQLGANMRNICKAVATLQGIVVSIEFSGLFLWILPSNLVCTTLDMSAMRSPNFRQIGALYTLVFLGINELYIYFFFFKVCFITVLEYSFRTVCDQCDFC